MDRIPAVRRVILAGIPPAQSAMWAVAAVAVSTAVRWAIDAGAAGIPFVTYFPAVALTAVFLGWRWGVATAVLSGLAANWAFVGPQQAFAFGRDDALREALFALSCVVLVWTGETARRLVRELEAAKQRESVLNHELMHRVKNMLATVNAMAVLTARHCEPGQFVTAFSGRMRALDRATELLGTGRDVHCEIRKLVESAIEPFRSGGNISAAGPPCELPRDACVPLALALHELCTNAAKHGALSSPEGKVELRWRIEGEGEAAEVRLEWRERDGPPVPEVRKAGMGTQLLRRQRGLKSVDVQFRPDGLRCDICIDGVSPPSAPAERAA